MAKNGVINTNTGELLRCGYADFENDGMFDPSKETYRTDVPTTARGKLDPRSNLVYKWTGSEWTTSQKGVRIDESELQYKVQSFSGFKLYEEYHYTTEINAATGFSGFSGIGRYDKYVYSGIKILGISSVYYDTIGEELETEYLQLSTTSSGNRIERKVKKK